MRAALFAILLALLAGCARYNQLADGIRFRIDRVGPNVCNPARQAETAEILRAVTDSAVDLNLWRRPQRIVDICVVDKLPGVNCAGYGLAGCATDTDPVHVLIATRYAPTPGSDALLPGYNWRAGLVDELIPALVFAGALDIPRIDPRFFDSDRQTRSIMEGNWRSQPAVVALRRGALERLAGQAAPAAE